MTSDPIVWSAVVGGVGLLAGRFVAPQIAALFVSRPPVLRAGLDAALGCVLTFTMTLLATTPSGLSATTAIVAGSVTALGVVWGSARGAEPSGGPEDLAGGRARRLGAWLGVLAASPLVFA